METSPRPETQDDSEVAAHQLLRKRVLRSLYLHGREATVLNQNPQEPITSISCKLRDPETEIEMDVQKHITNGDVALHISMNRIVEDGPTMHTTTYSMGKTGTWTRNESSMHVGGVSGDPAYDELMSAGHMLANFGALSDGSAFQPVPAEEALELAAQIERSVLADLPSIQF